MLAALTRLGPYEILAPLGAGGMGEVYRARDTRLGRAVAVKVLPEPFANNADRQARFEREARAVAALSHPNILAIHDYGTEGGITYAVMELLEGETLRNRLAKGALPWREAVEISAAIADGLAAAHAKGIIHRDLKPENLFLTADGRVKILDFGLARFEPAANPQEETSPYVPALTAIGMVMGTAAYMSPEQVRGRSVDARSDLFSFGCVLYEMVSGRRAFQRETDAETMTAILHDEPPDPASCGHLVPAELGHLIRQCLAKTPEKRFQTAAELEEALVAIEQTISASATPLEGVVPGRCPRCGRKNDGVNPAQPDSHKFCEGCGLVLIEPCLQCGTANTLWSNYCISCGTDLEARVRVDSQRWQSAREEIEAWVSSQRLADAINRLKEMVVLSHPRLASFSSWAKELLPTVESAYQEASQERDRLVAEAREQLKGHDYVAVLRVLEKCPPPFRTAEIEELLTKSQQAITELTGLYSDIKMAIHERAYDGLLPRVHRYLALRPGDDTIQKVLALLTKRERRSDVKLWVQATKRDDRTSYETYLALFPASLHAGEAQSELAAIYRTELMGDIRNVELRQKYLAYRAHAPYLQKEDRERAATCVFVNYSLFGAAGGAVGVVWVAFCLVNNLGWIFDAFPFGRNFYAFLSGLVMASLGGSLSAFILGVRKLNGGWLSNRQMVVYVAAFGLVLLVLWSSLVPELLREAPSWPEFPRSPTKLGLGLVFILCLFLLVGGLTAVTIAFLAGEHRRLSHLGPLPWRAYAQAPRKLHSTFLISGPRPPSTSPPRPKARL
jgi:serine/threonine protein kinase